MDSSGWLYCLSNSSMPGLLKIGQTKNEPKVRAEQLQTTGVPLPFKIEFAKYVKDYVKKEKILLNLLEQYYERINPKREFFKVSKEEVYAFFELIDGEYYKFNEETEIDNIVGTINNKIVNKNYDMKDYFTDGMKIRHKIGMTNIWIGIYDKLTNTIRYKNEIFTSLSQFKCAHYINHNPDLKGKKDTYGNAWVLCEYEKDNEWISTFELLN